MRELIKFLIACLLVVGSCIGISFWAWGPPIRDDLPVTLHEGDLYDKWQQSESADPTRLYFEVTLYQSKFWKDVNVELRSKPALDLQLEPLDSKRIRPYESFVVRGSILREFAAPEDSIEFILHGMHGQKARTRWLDSQLMLDGNTLIVR
ncbi:hypothetical protein [Herpetosiphon geysericola]|uniref:Lipoprotein n=1 Tax=Herpetosiphon geysericola TaxID=70996 RepID=A0A0P6Z3V9_9CHLR|nr:hypothetical protein [Herpetosiphon geysericola]KPL91916.1 hypothetical protein SE18_00745 [Herpetosiphon geysericola]